jgi:hypothetical protein
MIYVQSRYLCTILLDAPRSLLGDFFEPGASHAIDGLIGSMYHTYPHPTLLGPNGYGHPYGGINISHPQPLRGYSSTSHGYLNPPKYPSPPSLQLGTSTSYPAPHVHPLGQGPPYQISLYGGVAMNPYYPFLGPPPPTKAPATTVPNPLLVNLHPLHKGKCMHKKMLPIPPN